MIAYQSSPNAVAAAIATNYRRKSDSTACKHKVKKAALPRDIVVPLEVTNNKKLNKTTSTSTTTTTTTSTEPYSDFGKKSPRVRFAVTIKKHVILSRDDYTEREKRKSWYLLEERQKYEMKRDKILRRIEDGKRPKRNMTYRGLEHWTVGGGYLLSVQVGKVVDAVMDEQEEQWAANYDDCNLLATVSRRISITSAEDAFNQAMEDEEEAIKALEEDDFFDDDDDTCTISTPTSYRSFASYSSFGSPRAVKKRINIQQLQQQRQQQIQSPRQEDPPGTLQRKESKTIEQLEETQQISTSRIRLKVQPPGPFHTEPRRQAEPPTPPKQMKKKVKVTRRRGSKTAKSMRKARRSNNILMTKSRVL